jgi:zinc protease
MRLTTLFLAALLALPATARAAVPLDPKFDPKKLTTPPLGRIQIVQPERVKLANGTVVFLLENHDLPVVSGVLYVKTNPDWIPVDRAGIGRVTGEVIRSGGTATHSGDWLDDHLAAIGASINSGLGIDLANAGFRCLTDNTAEVIGLFADVVRNPAIPEDKIELSRVGLRREIASRNDEMIPLLVRTAAAAVYGKNNPYAREAEYATVEAIQKDDVQALYRKIFEPSRAVLAIYGDFRSADMKKLLAQRFGDWKSAGTPLPALPPTPEIHASRLVFAPKEDVTQSGIILTHPGFRADDPDYAAMDVLQTALGGGFQSRLVNRIRTERGLAYSTGAGAGVDYQRPGLFVAYSLTKSESTMVALDLLREEVRKVTEAPLTAEELKTAKESVLNQFVFNFEQPSSVLFRSAFFEITGYPQDFLQRYQQAVEAVTAQSVLEAARRKIHPDQMVAIVVGKEKDFDRPLATAGLALDRMDITIPPPPSKVNKGEATPEALARGRAMLGKAAEVAGGSAAWASLKSVSLAQHQTISIQGQSMAIDSKMSWVLPNRWLAIQKLPMGEMKEGYDGTAGWRSVMNQVQDHPKAAEQVKEEYERSFFHLFGHPESVRAQALDPQTIDGVSYQVAAVTSEVLHDWTLFFAPDGSLARMEYQGDGPQGPARLTEIYSDWKATGAVRYPHQTQVLVDGKPLLDGKLDTLEFNVALDETQFKKPAQ